jgi:Zn-dependent protease
LGGSEISQILLSAVVLGLAFSIITEFTVESFFWAVVTIGVGFIGHELAHKFVAMRFGYWAAYRIWPMGLVLALLSAMVGFIFAALGTVQIFGRNISREEEGIISLSGPVFNMVLSVILMGLAVVIDARYSVYLGFGAYLNALIALFNCLPFSILDGQKIFNWDRTVWGLSFAVAATLLVLNWF